MIRVSQATLYGLIADVFFCLENNVPAGIHDKTLDSLIRSIDFELSKIKRAVRNRKYQNRLRLSRELCYNTPVVA